MSQAEHDPDVLANNLARPPFVERVSGGQSPATTAQAVAIEPQPEDFRALADSIPQLAWIADGRGSIFWYNRRWYDYTGTSPAEMTGWGWRKVHHPDHVERIVETFGDSIRRGEAWEDSFPLRAADGTYSWFLSRAQPIRDEAGAIVRWFGTNTDTTEQLAYEHNLQRSERRFRSLIEASAAIVWTMPASGEMTQPQPEWSAFTGQTFEELRGWGWLEAIHPDDRPAAAQQWTQAVESRSSYEIEQRIRRRDGTWCWMMVRAAPVVNEDGTLQEWIGVTIDISARKLAEEQLEAARNEADAANRAKSQFIANMSHELRTPLSAVIGYSEMLEEEVEEMGHTHLLEDLRKINANARHLLSLISDVLDLSKIEANRMTVFAETFDVAELVSGVASTVDSLVRKKENELVVELESDLGIMHTDQVKMRQCLFNLLGNAAKFTDGGRIGLQVKRTVEDGRDWLHFAVTDSGIGMNEDQLSRLFSRFSQADESTTRKFGGTGLGLAITRGFAELLGGTITVTSKEGMGSTFTLDLPAQLEAAPPAADSDTGPESPNVVLVVDDDAATRDLISRFLHREGFQVRSTGDGRSGLALARSLKPKVILLDVMMPQMDGWTVLSAIKADPEIADTPVVMVSFVNEQALAASLGASGYLTKPVEWDQLKQVMDRFRNQELDGVLVIDDDEVARERLRTMLVRQGMKVTTAENGAIALERVRQAIPSLILLDLKMPEMDGFSFLEALRQEPEWQEIPVVVVTAKDLDPEDRRRLQGQVDRVIAKGSVNLHNLASELRSIIPTES